jgi:two-component system, NarL family, sensor histidine kinase DegS
MNPLMAALEADMSQLRRQVRLALLALGPSSPLTDLEESVAALAGRVLELKQALSHGDGQEADAPAVPDVPFMRSVVSTEEWARRLASELEMEFGHLLANAVVEIDYAQPLLDHDPRAVRDGLQHLRMEMEQGLSRLRWLVADLRPPLLLNEMGLGPALIRYAQQFTSFTGIETICPTLARFVRRLPASAELAIFRIVQAALKNVYQHAGASRAEVGCEASADRLTFYVQDDGRGFETPQPRSGLGLIFMRERAQAIGGTLRIETRPGGGTRVSISL